MRCVILLVALLAAAWPATAARAGAVTDRMFTTSDGVRLHYLEAGRGQTIVMVPGWTMPAWIFAAQIEDFSRHWHVVALDPRAQGESDIAASGYEPYRRGRDIQELLQHLRVDDALLLGWSLGVLDVLSCVHQFGDEDIAGLVLVDNSVGEDPAPAPLPAPRRPRGRARPVPRDVEMRAFVRSMFRVPPSPDYLDRLTEAALRTPRSAAAALLAYPVPRSFWRDAVWSTNKPVLYLVTPRLSGQAASLEAHRPNAESVVFRNVGHAMFVDDPLHFDGVVEEFITYRLWR